jgi:cytochrome b561/uncharacterized protein YbjT (DUF2867 family)
MQGRDVFVTGGTGYIGTRLIPALLARGHRVRALARAQSVDRVAAGAVTLVGDALDSHSFVAALGPSDTLVHLVGTPHPSPAKAAEFRRVDLASVQAAATAAREAGIAHFIYISVARPAPVMAAYVAARAAGEQAIADARLTATVLRPWYVIGPGHRWPLLLVPFYAVAELVPAWRESARRLGLVTLDQIVGAIVRAVEQPPPPGTIRIVDVEGIDVRNARSTAATGAYSSIAKSLHWLVFALVLVQFVIGWTMPSIRRGVIPGRLINLHLSFGVLIMAVALIRVLWRRAYPVATAAENIPRWEQALARATHLLMYALLLLLPILGWAAASARDWTVRVFDLVTLPHLIAAGTKIGFIAGDAHVVLSYVLLGLIGLHVAAALYHYFVRRDRVLQRMLPGD